MIATDGCFGVGDAYQVCGFLPYSDLNHRWQRNLLTALVEAEIIPTGFAARVATWYPKGFITHSPPRTTAATPTSWGGCWSTCYATRWRRLAPAIDPAPTR
jgi:hypothetical protein